MDRIEGILEQALAKVNNDRYKLSCLVASRVKELSDGEKPCVNMDVTRHKLSDIALTEVAEGKIAIEKIENID